jgi:hypothetical protein
MEHQVQQPESNLKADEEKGQMQSWSKVTGRNEKTKAGPQPICSVSALIFSLKVKVLNRRAWMNGDYG